MKTDGMESNSRMAIWFGLYGLVIIDILFITTSLLFSLPDDLERAMMLFDFCVCILLLAEWVMYPSFSGMGYQFLFFITKIRIFKTERQLDFTHCFYTF